MRFVRSACVLILLLTVQFAAQNVNIKHPEEMDGRHQPTAEEMRDRQARAELQKDAKELSDLCASIPADMDGVKRGMLGQDLPGKLKRIEKLSKRVREELTTAMPAPQP